MNPLFKGFETLAAHVNRMVEGRLNFMDAGRDAVDDIVRRRFPEAVITPEVTIEQPQPAPEQQSGANVVSLVEHQDQITEAEAKVRAAYEEVKPELAPEIAGGNYDQKAA